VAGTDLTNYCLFQAKNNLVLNMNEYCARRAAGTPLNYSNPVDFPGTWDVSKATNLNNLFTCNQATAPPTNQESFCSAVTACATWDADIDGWDVSLVTSMDGTFDTGGGSRAMGFNTSLSSWNVAGVTSMKNMFKDSSSFYAYSNISSWNVAKVKNMEGMFYGTTLFDADISAWDVAKVTSMATMFQLSGFNQPLDVWNVAKTTKMNGMFEGSSFSKAINSWDVSNVDDMSRMFATTSTFDQNLYNWNTAKVTSMTEMFGSATSYNQPMSAWNTGKVASFKSMFSGATLFNQDISAWPSAWAAPPTTTTANGYHHMLYATALSDCNKRRMYETWLLKAGDRCDTLAAGWTACTPTTPGWSTTPGPAGIVDCYDNCFGGAQLGQTAESRITTCVDPQPTPATCWGNQFVNGVGKGAICNLSPPPSPPVSPPQPPFTPIG
jgi:surface protein